MSLDQGPDDAPDFEVEEEEPAKDTFTAPEDGLYALQVSTLPALYYHCCRIYKAMMSTAKLVEGEDAAEPRYLWEGSLTAVFEELNIGIAQYTPVTRRMKAMDCILQLRRGGGPQPSVWVLKGEPTVERFQHTNSDRAPTPKGKEKGKLETQNAQQLRDLNRRITRLENWARSEGAAI